MLYEFATVSGNTDGQLPTGSPTRVGNLLFGLTSEGGKAHQGTIYKYDTVHGTETVVHNFTGLAGDGSGPEDHLVAQGGLLYGVSISGGVAQEGTFFSFDPHMRAFHVLHDFGVSATDGAMPRNSAVYSNGMFYGTTFKGGTSNYGTVYSLDPASGQESVLYSFTGGADGLSPSDLLAVDGTLSGMTFDGGVAGAGRFTRSCRSSTVYRPCGETGGLGGMAHLPQPSCLSGRNCPLKLRLE